MFDVTDDADVHSRMGETSFAALLKDHLDRNIRPKERPKNELNRKRWSLQEFAIAVGVTESAVRNWLKGGNPPRKLDPIEKAFFGSDTGADDDVIAGLRRELKEAYKIACKIVDADAEHENARILPGHPSVAVPRDEIHRPLLRPRDLPFISLGLHFKGRDRHLSELHAALNPSRQKNTPDLAVIALHGLGGVGKTRLAVEYAIRYEEHYSALLFARADPAAQLNVSLATMAGPAVLNLPENAEDGNEAKISAVLMWLKVHPNWLLIIDNVDDKTAVTAISQLLTKLVGGKVIITGRFTRYPASIEKFEVNVLSIEDSVEFLLSRTNGDREHTSIDAKISRELSTELDGLPLGLEQAGAYIATDHISFIHYLKLWREKRETVIRWFDKDLMTYDRDTGLAATWATSVDRLTSDSRLLLDWLADFAPDPIPTKMLDLISTDGSGNDVRSALSGLYAYSLVSQARTKARNVSEEGFAVHRLVQNFTRRVMQEEQRNRNLQGAHLWIERAFEQKLQGNNHSEWADSLEPHAVQVATRAVSVANWSIASDLYLQLGRFYQQSARFAEAEHTSRISVSMFEERIGVEDVNYITALHNLGQVLRETNQLEESESVMRKAVQLAERRFGDNHPGVAAYLGSLASLLRLRNNVTEVESMMRRAVGILERAPPEFFGLYASNLNNLAQFLRGANRLNEAEPLMRKLLEIVEGNVGKDHLDVAAPLNNLAQLLRATGRINEAIPLYMRALDIISANVQDDHPLIANILNNLGQIYLNERMYVDAENAMMAVFEIYSRNFSENHPNIGLALNNIGTLYYRTGRGDLAQALFMRALAIFENAYGPDHPNTKMARRNVYE